MTKAGKKQDAMIKRLMTLKQETEMKKKRAEERKKKARMQRAGMRVMPDDLDPLKQGPMKRVLDKVRDTADSSTDILTELKESNDALEIRIKLKSRQPNTSTQGQDRNDGSKSGSSILGLRRPGGQSYEGSDPAPSSTLAKESDVRTIHRHKVHEPSHDQVHTALEKLMRKKTFDRKAVIREMNEREREHELRLIKRKRFL